MVIPKNKTAEVLKMTGNSSKDLWMKRITPRQLQLGTMGQEELDTLIKATIAGGRLISHFHKQLIVKNNGFGVSRTYPPIQRIHDALLHMTAIQ